MRRIPQRLSSRLLFALTIIALLSVLSVGVAAYFSERSALMEQVSSELDTLIQLKEVQLSEWLIERKSDLRLVAMSKLNQECIMALMSPASDAPGKERCDQILLYNLTSIREHHAYYRQIEILNVEGRVVVSNDPRRNQQVITDGALFQRILASAPDAYVGDLALNPDTNGIEMVFGQVIYSDDADPAGRQIQPSPQAIGVVTLNLIVTDSLFPLLNTWPGHMNTGEVMLVRSMENDILILNPLIQAPHKALSLRIPKNSAVASPLEMALRGASGTMLTQDYRDIPVVVAYRPIKEMPWGILVKVDRQEAFAPIVSLAYQISIVAIASFLVAWTFAFVLWRRIALPLAQLVRATQSVIDGDYSVDLRMTHDDEIGLLARSFEEMLNTLARRQSELQMANRVIADTALTNTRLVKELKSLNIELETKVQHRTKELSEANQKLTQLDHLKSKFISNVSHELRNPVASLKLYQRLLERSTDANRERYIAGISGQIDWLSKLIENILDLTQLEHGATQLEFASFDLRRLVLQVVELYEPIAEDSNIAMSWALHDTPLYIYGSESKLRQMITNLLANAVNYTPKGQINVQLNCIENNALLIVEDTGIGIEEEDLPHLFDRFYRGKNTHELEIRGTGLGLGIVNEIIEMHAGHIEVESQISVGSRFRVSLPLSDPVEREQRSSDAVHRRRVNTEAVAINFWPTDVEEPDR